MKLTFNVWLVDLLSKKELTLGSVIQFPEPIIVPCGIIKVEFSGSAVGKFDGIKKGTGTKTGEFNFNISGEKQELTECFLLQSICLEGELFKKLVLLSRLSFESPFQEMPMEMKGDKVMFAKEVTVQY